MLKWKITVYFSILHAFLPGNCSFFSLLLLLASVLGQQKSVGLFLFSGASLAKNTRMGMSHVWKQFPFCLLHFYVLLVCRSWSQNVRWACRAVNMMLKNRDQTPGHREENCSWHLKYEQRPMGILTNVFKPPALKDSFCSCHNSPAFPQQQNPVHCKFRGQNYSRPHLMRGKFISVCHQIKAVVWTDNGEQQNSGEDGVLKIIWRWIKIPGWKSQAHRI